MKTEYRLVRQFCRDILKEIITGHLLHFGYMLSPNDFIINTFSTKFGEWRMGSTSTYMAFSVFAPIQAFVCRKVTGFTSLRYTLG